MMDMNASGITPEQAEREVRQGLSLLQLTLEQHNFLQGCVSLLIDGRQERAPPDGGEVCL